ncbi:polysaccharide deacetylase family protein [Pelagibius sp.]|uniref:polysaccharide deacetylase family protein n=1 Tax=Pelagibius sp. TaxID=1931238 RepID=UPI003B50E4C0
MWDLASAAAVQRFGLVVVYHGVFEEPPEELRGNLHNVPPEAFAAQISWIDKHFEIVTLDDFMAADWVAGKAVITFDDAYICVFENAVPLLRARGLPFTVFINGRTLEGRPFWRDKIRCLINHGLVKDFIAFREHYNGLSDSVQASGFYRSSKAPGVNSRRLDEELDAFVESRKGSLTFDALSHHIARPSDLIAEEGVTYGNHGYSHYVMSSLDRAEQKEEIERNQALLASLNLPLTRTFAFPFGGARDFTTTTIELLRATGYSGGLYSRNRLNQASREGQFLAERFMPSADMGQFHKRLLMAFYRTLRPSSIDG